MSPIPRIGEDLFAWNSYYTTATQWASVLRQRVYTAKGTFTVKMTVRDRGSLVGTANTLTVKVQ